MSGQLNYDPADPDKMRLVSGVTCGDCSHFKRCKAMFGHTETDTYCDWSPSRFVAAPIPTKPACGGNCQGCSNTIEEGTPA